MNAERTLELISPSPTATERLGEALARLLPGGSTVALYGDLATGKTCLVRGMAAHFTGRREAHSPTFTLINEYRGNPTLYHIDLYRLAGPEEAAELGCEEIFDSPDVCAVEWAERAERLLPDRCIRIVMRHAGNDRRAVRIADPALLPEGWEEVLRLAISEAE
ncbi:MAG TPA: tRNA (adenosine(37)-N6)-threonylcarbamoyltransferase complex ATPase subunit type 1 TsaE [Candidatus Hydrogenedentes bacterium]|nr:tRNA (adenosine(37)-N6)-threonylcarbamoyltransferase complex ATPase subunit type 1 TsaE [Candidatus Hydrogenedentota bacterium]